MFGALHCFSVFKSIQNHLPRINPCCYGRSVHHFTYATTHAQIQTQFTHRLGNGKNDSHFIPMERSYQKRKDAFYIVEMAFTFRLYGGARYHESKYGQSVTLDLHKRDVFSLNTISGYCHHKKLKGRKNIYISQLWYDSISSQQQSCSD